MLLDVPELTGKTLNMGTGTEYTIKMVVETIARLMKKQQVGIDFIDARPADVPRLWVDARTFYALTGFQAERSFEERLQETIAYYATLATQKNLLSEVVVKNWEGTAEL
jgi:UDP-glucose 4-epimerase